MDICFKQAPKKQLNIMLYKIKKLVILFLLLNVAITNSYAMPNVTKPELRIKLNMSRDQMDSLRLIKEILEERYDVVILEVGDHSNYDMILTGIYGKETIDPDDKALKIFYTHEAANPDLELHDLSIGFNYDIDSPKYFRLPLYQMWFGDKLSTEFQRGKCNTNKKYFACFLVTNPGVKVSRFEKYLYKLYSLFGMNDNYFDKIKITTNYLNGKEWDGAFARYKIFKKLSEYKYVASGGNFLNNIGYNIEYGSGFLESGAEFFKQCKFTISYENQKFNGYITEKLFSSYFAGSMPIYYGDHSVLRDVNKDAFIYSDDFASDTDLIDYIKKLDQDDGLYCEKWNNKLLIDKEQNYDVFKNRLSKKLYQLIDKKLGL